MATYKVLQDIEAEDHLVGPLTLRQLIWAGVAAGLLGLGWWLSTFFGWWLLAVLALPALPFIFLALPLGQDLSNEAWLMSRLNYFLRPRQRIWQQEGQVEHLVISQAPADTQVPVIDRLNPRQLDTKLDSLANLLDYPGQPSQVVAQSAMISPQQPHPAVAAATINRQTGQLETYFDQLLVNQRRAALTTPAGQMPANEPDQRLQPLSQTDDLRVSTLASMANQGKG